ncbi:hypothetical protein F511_08206 [Dorcoceras hygrometricum]|uniref:HXXXD-type acyl-transferase family protein n=1 Tax=Dorcoceras hygrometricum TaxID=472368 RepID=A0A2Z7BZB2_9LAMI|nr:hypothetical protein F511_08206 [Dorcoceras hygrometricum]
MSEIRGISTSIVRATNNSPAKIHLTPWDLQLLLLDPIQKGLLYHKSNIQENTRSFLEHLENSLSRTLDFFPPLAGRLGTVKHEDTDAQSFYIDCNNEGAQFTHSIATGITVNDILKAKYVPAIVRSFFLLNGVCNIEGISKPLLAIQVTELEDGYFVGCTLNHSVGDGTSFWNFLNSWSEISRGFQFPSKLPSLNRWFPEYVDSQIRIPVLDEKLLIRFISLPILEERVFHFMLAHIWRSIIRSRNVNEDDGRDVSMRILVGARRRLRDPPLPDAYFGNAIHMIYVNTTASTLLSRGHSWASAQLNQAVAAQTEEETKNFYKKWVKCPQVYSRNELKNDSLVTSSSPRFDVYGTDFGWGKPIAVRSGLGNKSDGKITLFPGPEPGSMDIEICLLKEKLWRLENDVDFMEFVQI